MLTAILGCDTRRVIHTLHYALCHADTSHNNSDTNPSNTPTSHSVSVLEQNLEEAKCFLFSDLFLTNVVHQLESQSMDGYHEMLNTRLRRPWCNHGSVLKSKHSYIQLDTASSACDYLTDCDIIGSNEQSHVLDLNNAHCWWNVTEQCCLLETVEQLPGQLEVEKVKKRRDEIMLHMERLTEQNFSVANSEFVGEEFLLKAAEKCRLVCVCVCVCVSMCLCMCVV